MYEPFVYKLFTGKVRTIGNPNAKEPMDREWTTGIFKEPTEEKIWLSRTGLDGDEHGDKKNHGGPEKALFAYPIKHYKMWQQELDIEIDIGGMGENLAVLEMDEYSVCIGDTYEFGDAVIQVSQPRQPCWRPARRHRIKDLALQIQNTGRTGWYFRVLEEGNVISRIDLELIDRPNPDWTIAAANEIMHIHKDNLRMTEELASVKELAPNWKRSLKQRLRGRERDISKRVYGPNK